VAERLLTGVIELTCGVWSLSGAGALAGKLSMAAFMLGWAGLSVHCQVLSFIAAAGSPSDLSLRQGPARRYLRLLIFCITRFLCFEEPVSAYLAQQVEAIAGMDFRSALVISLLVVWSVWILFLFVSPGSSEKTVENGRKLWYHTVQEFLIFRRRLAGSHPNGRKCRALPEKN
jgi:hypothetical protein